MKVIRLVEALYTWDKFLNERPQLAKMWNDAGLTQDEFIRNDFDSDEAIRTYIDKLNPASEAEYKYTDVDVNDIRNSFESKKPNKDEAIGKLNNLFSQVGSYGKNTATNVSEVLNNFDFKFIKYFLECLGYDKLGNKNNSVLTAMASNGLASKIGSDKLFFTQLFNMASNEALDLDANYLGDNNALIYDRDLYKNVSDEDTLYDIIKKDTETKDPAWRSMVKENAKNGNLDQFASGGASKTKNVSKASELVNNMTDNDKIKFFMEQGMTKDAAIKFVNSRTNENNNK